MPNADFTKTTEGKNMSNDTAPQEGAPTFQTEVAQWMLKCFTPEITADKVERNHRFLEESLELVQAIGCTQSEAHQLVEYVYGRDIGDPQQEVGGVMVTLAALCLANSMRMGSCGYVELERINNPETILKIRKKQAAKPKHSQLPQHIRKDLSDARIAELVDALSDLACLGNGNEWGNSEGNRIAQDAILGIKSEGEG